MKKIKLEKLGLEKFTKSSEWLLNYSQRNSVFGGRGSICNTNCSRTLDIMTGLYVDDCSDTEFDER